MNGNSVKMIKVLFGFFVCFACLYLYESLPGQRWSIANWNFIKFSLIKYQFAFLIYLFTVMFLYAGNRAHKNIYLGLASFILSTYLWGVFFFVLFMISCLLYQFLYCKIPRPLKWILLFILYEGLIYLTLSHWNTNNIFFWYAFIFILFFVLRFALFIYHNIQSGFKREPIADYLLYMFCPAFFIISPHIAILPEYEYFTQSFADEKKKFLNISMSGVYSFGKGLALLFLCYGSFLTNDTIQTRAALHPWLTAGLDLFVQYFGLLLLICGYGYLSYGMVRGLGYDIKAPFNNPFRAVNVIDLFSRFLIYFKDLVFKVLFVPFSLKLKGLRPIPRSFWATVGAIVVGFTLHNYFSLGMDFCSVHMNTIVGPERILRRYANDLGLELGFWSLHFKWVVIAIASAFYGMIFAGQLIYIQSVKFDKRMPVIFKSNLAKSASKVFQYLLMVIIISSLFIWPFLGG